MKHLIRAGSLLLACSIVSVALAEPPSFVTGLDAEYRNGEVIVSWDAQPGEDVAYYRVYYSFESILENNGLYDDFETTEGPVTTYTIENPPDIDLLYIAVIGVSSAEEDSNLFVEEVAVDLTQEASDPEPSSLFPEEPDGSEWESMEEDLPPGDVPEPEPIDEPLVDSSSGAAQEESLEIKDETFVLPGSEDEQPEDMTPPDETTDETPDEEPEATMLGIESIEATSPTEVAVTFTAPIMVEIEDAPKAFSIVDAFDGVLPIVRMVIEGDKAVVTTAQQNRNQVYEFHFDDPAYNPDGLPIDPRGKRAFFDGHPEGITEDMLDTDDGTPDVGPLRGIENLQLKSVQQADGLYAITVQWDIIGDTTEVASYVVKQTRDGGATFGQPQTLTSNIRGIQIPNVTPGQFGLSIAPVRTDGKTLTSAFRSITLGNVTNTPPITGTVAPPAAEVTGTVTTPPMESNLSRTGAGAAALSLIAGGSVLGWRRSKKKKA